MSDITLKRKYLDYYVSSFTGKDGNNVELHYLVILDESNNYFQSRYQKYTITKELAEQLELQKVNEKLRGKEVIINGDLITIQGVSKIIVRSIVLSEK